MTINGAGVVKWTRSPHACSFVKKHMSLGKFSTPCASSARKVTAFQKGNERNVGPQKAVTFTFLSLPFLRLNSNFLIIVAKLAVAC